MVAAACDFYRWMQRCSELRWTHWVMIFVWKNFVSFIDITHQLERVWNKFIDDLIILDKFKFSSTINKKIILLITWANVLVFNWLQRVWRAMLMSQFVKSMSRTCSTCVSKFLPYTNRSLLIHELKLSIIKTRRIFWAYCYI